MIPVWILAAFAAVALLAALSARSRATRALRVASQHEEALRLAAMELPLEPPAWGPADPCGCHWRRGLPGGDPVWVPCPAAMSELLRLINEEAGMCAHCPDCGEEMQDEAFEFWCPRCQAAVSYARVAAEGA